VYGSLGTSSDGGDAEEARPERKVVDVTVKMEEDKPVLRSARSTSPERLDAGQGDPAGDLHE